MSRMGKIIATADAGDTTAAERMGEMLWSAIRHGCLLDRGWWAAWMKGVQDAISIDGAVLAVDMQRIDAGGTAVVRRWFADPITKILIIRWHRERLCLADFLEPAACLMLHRPANEPDTIDAEAFCSGVFRAWRFRLPGLLLANAGGTAPSSSLPRATWEAIVHGHNRSHPDPINAPAKVRSPAAGSLRTDAIKEEMAALRPAKNSYRSRKAEVKASKKAAAEAIGALPPSGSPMREALRTWCIFALSRERSGRVSIGYSLPTVNGYLRSLAHLFAEWRGVSPLTAAAVDVADYMIAALDGMEGKQLGTAVKAVRSFQRCRRRECPCDPLDVDLAPYEVEQTGSPNVVTPQAFADTVRALDRDGEADLALMVILMFRAGLRIEEVAALRVGDVNSAKGNIELVVEAHDHRPLKTKTSRRIIPLDVLLEPDECARLLERMRQRRAASGVGIEAWLFGRSTAIAPPPWKPIENLLAAVLRLATGIDGMTAHHLRHSFASYVLATLMLPREIDGTMIPARLASVISLDRLDRISDRLLGQQRLGAGALHAVSQLMGHTGPDMTLRYYCHLLDLSLGICCNQPATLPPVDREWLMATLGIGHDALRKAAARAPAAAKSPLGKDYARPDPQAIRYWSPEIERKAANAQVLAAGFQRLARPVVRGLAAARDEVPAREEAARYKAHVDAAECGKEAEPAPRKRRRPTSSTVSGQRRYAVPWREIAAALDPASSQTLKTTDRASKWRETASHLAARRGKTATAIAVPPQPEAARLIDERLWLARAPRRRERIALDEVVFRWRRGQAGIKLARLADARAFVTLLGVMGFVRSEVNLSLTSNHGSNLASDEIHRFLIDPTVAPQLAGRRGWRGSLVVRLRPDNVDQPIVAARACKLSLLYLAINEAAF